jgi:hypothetical protein
MNKYDAITVKQIDYMKHAIGYEPKRVSRKTYRVWRNYFTTSIPSKTWDALVELGLAEQRPFPQGGGENPQVYSVTWEGLNFLGSLLGITMVVEKG